MPVGFLGEQQSTENHRRKEHAQTGCLVQTPHFIGEHREGKEPSHGLPGGSSDPGRTLSLSHTDLGPRARETVPSRHHLYGNPWPENPVGELAGVEVKMLLHPTREATSFLSKGDLEGKVAILGVHFPHL